MAILRRPGGNFTEKNIRELVKQIQRDTVERYQEQKQKGRQLVEAMFREALERERQEKERKPAPIEKSPGKALDQGNVLRLSLMKTPQNYYGEQPLSRPESQLQRRTIHYSELPEDKSDGPISREWNFYRREVGRLLAEGNEDRWILIKGEEIVGIWDTEDEAEQVRLQSFLMQAVLLKQICFREPILRAGNHRRWLS